MRESLARIEVRLTQLQSSSRVSQIPLAKYPHPSQNFQYQAISNSNYINPQNQQYPIQQQRLATDFVQNVNPTNSNFIGSDSNNPSNINYFPGQNIKFNQPYQNNFNNNNPNFINTHSGYHIRGIPPPSIKVLFIFCGYLIHLAKFISN